MQGYDCLYMGNLDSLRDWGHARDYVEMQWRMLKRGHQKISSLQQGDRRVCAGSLTYCGRAQLGDDRMVWRGLEETGKRGDTGDVVVRIDPRYFRPSEVETLLGDSSKAQETRLVCTSLEELVAEMVSADKLEAKEALLKRRVLE